jgi:four helix bundle protein
MEEISSGHLPGDLALNADELKLRTKAFAKRIIRLCRSLPRTEECYLIRRQMFRAGTSVGANYRAACRARSPADFVSKLGIVLEESDETLYWLEIIAETEIVAKKPLESLMRENNELISIFVASLNTAKN